jgi:hypothetical protein
MPSLNSQSHIIISKLTQQGCTSLLVFSDNIYSSNVYHYHFNTVNSSAIFFLVDLPHCPQVTQAQSQANSAEITFCSLVYAKRR